MKKNLLKYLIYGTVSIIGLSFLTAFSSSIFAQNSKLIYKLSNNIYLNSDTLNKTLLVYKSSDDISDAYFKSSCNIETKLITKKEDLYLFELTINDPNCTNSNIYLVSKLGILNSTELNLISDYKLYSILLDYSTSELNNSLETLNKNSSKYKIFTDYRDNILNDKYNFSNKKRVYDELIYKGELVQKILNARNTKYLIPVPGYKLPTNLSKIPNAGRPYRAGTTDGIHHSWDIDTPFGQKVVALDDGIIIRIVKNWDKTDLKNIREGENLSIEDKMRNLDILRGNQVWIKTMKGEIVMYAHFDKVVDSLNEGTMIKKGDYIGNIGVTGVPDDNYTDYHLDFSISENPNNLGKAGSYEIVDYMSWPWKFKGKSSQYILAHQNELFESN
nr:M23 family metallopeptidase [Candidatus Gracilibacteria bacterium]